MSVPVAGYGGVSDVVVLPSPNLYRMPLGTTVVLPSSSPGARAGFSDSCSGSGEGEGGDGTARCGGGKEAAVLLSLTQSEYEIDMGDVVTTGCDDGGGTTETYPPYSYPFDRHTQQQSQQSQQSPPQSQSQPGEAKKAVGLVNNGSRDAFVVVMAWVDDDSDKLEKGLGNTNNNNYNNRMIIIMIISVVIK